MVSENADFLNVWFVFFLDLCVWNRKYSLSMTATETIWLNEKAFLLIAFYRHKFSAQHSCQVKNVWRYDKWHVYAVSWKGINMKSLYISDAPFIGTLDKSIEHRKIVSMKRIKQQGCFLECFPTSTLKFWNGSQKFEIHIPYYSPPEWKNHAFFEQWIFRTWSSKEPFFGAYQA